MIIHNIVEFIALIDKSWKEQTKLYGVEADKSKGYFAYRNEVFRRYKSSLY